MRRSTGWAWTLACGSVGVACLVVATADARGGLLVRLAENVQRGPGLSAITVRALEQLRWWLVAVGSWAVVAGVAGVLPRAVPAPDITPRLLELWPAGVAIGMAAWTLPLGFVSDDYLWLFAWHKTGLGVLAPAAGSPHYIPLGLLLCNLPHAVFGLTPLPYRVLTLVLHGGVCALVARAARLSGLGPTLAIGAGVLCATTSLAYEPVLWATGQFYLWPGVLTAWVLTVLLRPPEEISPRLAWSAGIAAALAGFVIEQAAALALFTFLWALFRPGARLSRDVRLPLAVFPLAGGLALVALRAGTRPPADAFVGVAQVARNVCHLLGGMAVFNSPAGHMLGGWLGTSPPLAACALVLFIAGCGLLWRYAGPTGRTLLGAWLVLWLPALAFAPQSSRYWYLPAIPASIGIARLLAALEGWLAARGFGRPQTVTGAAILAWAVLGVLAMVLRVPDWRLAERTARNVEHGLAEAMVEATRLQGLDDLAPQEDTPARVQRSLWVMAFDVPDGVGTDLWPAYVWLNGLREALAFRFPGWEGELTLLEGPHRPWPRPYLADHDTTLELPLWHYPVWTIFMVYDSTTHGVRQLEQNDLAPRT